MSDIDEFSNDRSEESGRSSYAVNINPLAGDNEIDRGIERAARQARFQRNERWENSRQYLVLFSLGSMALVLLFAFLWSAWVLLPSAAEEQRELARWVVETEVGGLVAGLIGLWVVKSFEK